MITDVEKTSFSLDSPPLPNSKVMLHDLAGGAVGKYKDIMVEVEEINKIHDILKQE